MCELLNKRVMMCYDLVSQQIRVPCHVIFWEHRIFSNLVNNNIQFAHASKDSFVDICNL